ncbi:hypothetical protein A2773_04655 [Candidatus Gottesmanbacteria bacterium RIFCSPHIGHO2_01_FULL_39_10]|uniref:NADPH-dependent FMN reductase-like domain-containing protein n=1 Tax=Candidatus Gottesmanbacteria bacterium RIFCSPHIGHO2_01_FULL_39_10 TaxID=1798375 RepID=A0A1F5ZRZ9_9BACT|nr:MAG: hypothetical protein A2773_04655 [Candidatus Gottesmanbacteria bacterium RIFCSPHIGHO2_01_FULL_39_10]
MLKIGVILGSIREIRRGARVAKWLMGQLKQYKDIDVELLDLRDYPLPFYNENNSPEGLKGKYSNKIAKKWAAKIGEKDGFIFIVSEYNHGPTAVLKNALDWLYYEWNRKAVSFVSYATGLGAGIRAVEQLRGIAVELEMAPLQKAIHIGQVLDILDEDGNVLKSHVNDRVANMMQELLWWTKTLKAAREKTKND